MSTADNGATYPPQWSHCGTRPPTTHRPRLSRIGLTARLILTRFHTASHIDQLNATLPESAARDLFFIFLSCGRFVVPGSTSFLACPSFDCHALAFQFTLKWAVNRLLQHLSLREKSPAIPTKTVPSKTGIGLGRYRLH